MTDKTVLNFLQQEHLNIPWIIDSRQVDLLHRFWEWVRDTMPHAIEQESTCRFCGHQHEGRTLAECRKYWKAELPDIEQEVSSDADLQIMKQAISSKEAAHHLFDPQEDSMSEVKFTKEEAEEQRNDLNEFLKWCAGRPYHQVVLDEVRNYRNWLDAHTERELTFPCPACGENMSYYEDGNEYRCITYNCSIYAVKRNTDKSLEKFSEALDS